MIRIEFIIRLSCTFILVLTSLILMYSLKGSRRPNISLSAINPVENWLICKDHSLIHPGTPTIYVITPSILGPQQIADLTRLQQTFEMIVHLHWIVTEDAENCTEDLNAFFNRWPDLSYTLIASPTPEIFLAPETVEQYGLPTGISGRRSALKFILQKKNRAFTFLNGREDVIYFADPGYTYDIDIFNDMRKVKTVGMFPVGLSDPLGVSSPIVGYSGKVVGFLNRDRNQAGHKFPVSLFGFCVAVPFIRNKRPQMAYRSGWETETFLRSLELGYDQIEALENNCTKINVWSSGLSHARPKVFQIEGPKVENINVDKLVEKLSGTKNINPGQDNYYGEKQKLYVCQGHGCEEIY